MRRLSPFAAAFATTVIACGGPPEAPVPAAPPVSANATPTPPTASATPLPATPPPAPSQPQSEITNRAVDAYASALAGKGTVPLADGFVRKTPGAPESNEATGAPYVQGATGVTVTQYDRRRTFIVDDVAIVEATVTASFTAGKKPVTKTFVAADVFRVNPAGALKKLHTYVNHATVYALNGQSKDPPRAAPPNAEPFVTVAVNRDKDEAGLGVLKLLNDAWDHHDDKAYVALFADGGSWNDWTLEKPAKGPKELGAYFGSFSKPFPDAKTTSRGRWVVGDWVIEEGTYAGTHKAKLYDLPPTQKAMTLHELTILHLKDGKILDGTSYSSDAELYGQLGKPLVKEAKK